MRSYEYLLTVSTVADAPAILQRKSTVAGVAFVAKLSLPFGRADTIVECAHSLSAAGVLEFGEQLDSGAARRATRVALDTCLSTASSFPLGASAEGTVAVC